MRVGLSFLGACLMALLLFALMLYMVTPPRTQVSQDPVSVASFVRAPGTDGDSASRSRQKAPTPPQAPTPTPPTPAAPAPAATANLPKLDIQLPSIDSGISVSAAPAPSLNGLMAGAAAASAASGPASAAPGSGEGGGQPGGVESEVMPLNDVRPQYPNHARQRGIEGHVKLAFTINRSGGVENIRVLEAEPRNVFEREARRAAARWRFAPRTENGLAVNREAVKTLYFRLERN